MDVKRLKGLRLDGEVDFGDGEPGLKITFRREGISLAELRAIEDGDESAIAQYEGNVAFLLKIDLQWDLTDDGEAVPVTQETLEARGIVLVSMIVSAVGAAVRGKARTSGS